MPFSTHVFQGVIYFVISIIGISGNIVVLFVLCRTKGPWKVSNIYLFNLAIADALFVIFLPFWGHYQFNGMIWNFGTYLCKTIGAITYVNMYASVLLLTAMSIDRWIAVVRATRQHSCRKLNLALGVCFSVWLLSLLLSLPSFIYRELRPYVSSNDTLSVNNSSNSTPSPVIDSNLTYMKCEFYISAENKNKMALMGALQFCRSIIGFIIPLSVIICCYIGIVCTVKKKTIKKNAQQDRVTKLSYIIITAFFLCWAPYHLLNLYSALGGWWQLFDANENLYYEIQPYFVCIAYANSCVNPILYAFSSSNFQKNMTILCCKKRPTFKDCESMRIIEDKSVKTCITPINSPDSRLLSRQVNCLVKKRESPLVSHFF